MTTKTPERTLVVAIVHTLTQFQHLPPQWLANDCRTRIVVTNDMRYVIENDNTVTKNFDMGITTDDVNFISGGGTHSNTRRNNAHLTDYVEGMHYQARETKTAQTLRMASLARLLQLKNFISPRIYSTQFADNRNSTFGPDIRGRVVVKPIDGARGIGQIVADMDKITPAALMILIKAAKDKDAFLEALEKLKPHVEYHIGHGDIEEGLTSLVEQGFFVQQQVPNVTAEFRLILTHKSEVAMIFKRKRDNIPLSDDANAFDYKQATGVTVLLEEAKPTGEYELNVHLDEITTFLKELDIPLNSVDLFFTDDGKWGVFEYCPQFGTEGIDQKIMEPFLRAQIENMLGIIPMLNYMTPEDTHRVIRAQGVETAERC
ncbi:hypothetical protein Xoosp14_94 [Xanthomonas phage Xoo-sp14]|nr:hypothetical protein Xoosp14_94 [Xanthomonas phage Xoo-sp14]